MSFREELDRQQWNKLCKDGRNAAARAFGVKKNKIKMAHPWDERHDLFVVYWEPPTETYQVWCCLLDVTKGAAIGNPQRFVTAESGLYDEEGVVGLVTPGAPGAYFAHAQEGKWVTAWDKEWVAEYRQYRADHL